MTLLLASACASSWYDQYRESHPDFAGGTPREGAALEEVLASIYAPSRVETIEVEVADLEIERSDRDPWQELRFDALRSGAFASSDEASYAVIATWRCRFKEGLQEHADVRTSYYLLPGNRLGPRDHYAFGDRCAPRNEFVAARGADAVADEREVMRRVAARSGATRLGLAQAYRRGLAYVEAGRLEEAGAMLVVGERGYREASTRLAPGQAPPESLVEAGRLREHLMRALGVEAR